MIRATLAKCGVDPSRIAALGVTNQRETAVMWDRDTGEPVCNAIVWQDTRTDRICRRLEEAGRAATFRHKAGLPLATYFTGPSFAGSSKTLTARKPGPTPAVCSAARLTAG